MPASLAEIIPFVEINVSLSVVLPAFELHERNSSLFAKGVGVKRNKMI
jgi:hypothetical protein